MKPSQLSSSGCLVTKLMAPPVALRPNSVPCGPRRISTRSMSKNSTEFRLVGTAISFRCRDTPDSPVRPITKLPMPRMEKLEPPKLVAVKETLGAFSCKSDGLMICSSSSMAPVSAVTAIGTSCTPSATRCAVTVISSSGAPSSCANAAAARIAAPIAAGALMAISNFLLAAHYT